MRRVILALAGCVLMFGAVGGGLLAVTVFGRTPTGLWIAAALCALAAGTLVAVGYRADRRTRAVFTEIADALGTNADPGAGETAFVKAMVRSLAFRLDRAGRYKAAFNVLPLPALIADMDGNVLFVSAGLAALAPDLAVGAHLAAELGATFTGPALAAGEPRRVLFGGRPYDVFCRPADDGLLAVGFARAGLVVGRNQLRAFAEALVEGQTGFRFSGNDVRRFPALATLNESMALIERSLEAMIDMTRGIDTPGPDTGLRLQLDEVRAALKILVASRDDALLACDGFGTRLDEMTEADERRTAVIARLRTAGGRIGVGAGEAAAVIDRGQDAAAALSATTPAARQHAEDAGGAAARAGQGVTRLEDLTGRIDKMIETIEDVSSRTNLLALNAAVEAGRAGDAGAGFAVVAEEVRTLARTTAAAARDIRTLVRQGQDLSHESAAAIAGLGELIAGLDGHLRKIHDETSIVVTALDDGGKALAGIARDIADMTQRTADDMPARRAHTR